MGAYNIVGAPTLVGGQPENVSQVLANFQAIQAVLNGGIDNTNLSAVAGVLLSQLGASGAVTGQVPVWNGSAWVAGSSADYSYGTSFPGAPGDGQLFGYVADDTNGVIWNFVWEASKSKWRFVGGPPLVSEVTTSESTTSTSFTDLATVGPSIVLPFAGDFDVGLGFTANPAATAVFAYMSYAIGGTGAVDADEALIASSGSNIYGSVARMRRKTGLTAVTLTAKFKTSGGSGASFANRFLAVCPVQK